ncbi:hypothetical protein QQS21_000121 [Conoideocrella luteorostrata]|uniref:Aminoglycoside phosphotransferase domain-containing protein n=1 Tax=Conoideocrella luteorostrata TaxID=1105319 RepID=A0AAJ0CZU8_9HYPO|nr:hypothetical protein QQS21_000121 [Conoideocrella luteorostrata]
MTADEKQAACARRMAVVNQLLHNLGLQISNASTVAYSAECQYAYNNYLFKVDLAVPATSSSFPGSQPGTAPAPSCGITSLLIKLSNSAAEANITNRVENDVASQFLVHQSMARAGLGSLIPVIYAWAPAKIQANTGADATANENTFGWTMMELKDGVDLDSEFPALDSLEKEKVLHQIAMIFKAIQDARLPETVTKFGGLTFNSTGQIISGEPPLWKQDPVETYLEWKFGNLHDLMQKASKSPVIQGWKLHGVGARIEKFFAAGGPEKVLSNVDQRQKCLIHGDFSTNNFLFDKDTKKITAILDFDWCTVSNPFDEFLLGLYDIGCNITYGKTKADMALLSGDFTQPPNLEKEKGENWGMAKMWNAAIESVGAASPRKIQGASQIYDLLLLKRLLCPYQLSNVSALEKMDDEKKAEVRAKTEADIVEWLDKHGF